MSKLVPNWQRSSVLEAVFNQLSDGLVLYDSELTITGVNRAAENLFGMSAEAMIGRPCSEVFRCAQCDAGCGMVAGLNASISLPNGTVLLRTTNGQERMAVIRTAHICDDDGRVQGVVATIKEITGESSRISAKLWPNRPPCAK